MMVSTAPIAKAFCGMFAALTLGAFHSEALGQPAGDSANGPVLRLLNWTDYMDPAILDAFAHETGVRVEERYFENDLARETGNNVREPLNRRVEITLGN